MEHIIETVSGAFVDLVNPDPDTLLIDDIAWALSRISRFSGHTITAVPYNVAQHSIFVSDLLSNSGETNDVALFGLLHDCAEAYLGDVPSPAKRIPELKEAFDKIENNLLNVIFKKFVGKIPTADDWKEIKRGDSESCRIEAFHFMRSRGLSWNIFNGKDAISLIDIQNFSQPEQAIVSYNKFLKRFSELTDGNFD